VGPRRTPMQQALNDPEFPWKEAFAVFDKNGDGTITKDELKAALEALGGKPSDEEVGRYMDTIDDDKSGRVEYPEFRRLMNKQMTTNQPIDTLRAAFKALDTQGTGKVNVGELRYVLTGVAGPSKLTDEEVDEILKDVPLTPDNFLEYENFLTSVIIQQ